MQPRIIKTTGYLISCVSVILLGIVAWSGVAGKPAMEACLLGGMAASIAGMFCRWLSYEREHRAQGSKPKPTSPATRTAG